MVLGSTRLKDRLLRRMGWRVVHVSYFEWDALRHDERANYLRSKLGST